MSPTDLILPSLFADALSLGPHWIYNPGKIRRLYPDGVHTYDNPHTRYHSGKEAGDFTHYGDQTLALLRSLATRGKSWSDAHWQRDWTDWATHTTAYLDGASKDTLANQDSESFEASKSNDLADQGIATLRFDFTGLGASGGDFAETSDDLETIRREGQAAVTLAGRTFTVGSRFLDDLDTHCQPCAIAKLNRDLIIFHAPGDDIVDIDNARRIYEAARHPKSFHSLAHADHLLTHPDDADYVTGIIAAWSRRLVQG